MGYESFDRIYYKGVHIDYNPNDEQSIHFFKTVQNKLHWAIVGQTAPEIIYTRVNSKKKNMGLTNFRGVKVRKEDVVIAKNYLDQEELDALNNLVEQYLIFAEGQAKRRVPMYMKDWIKKLHAFLEINDREILVNSGKISHELAVQTSKNEYEKYNAKVIESSDNDLTNLSEEFEKLSRKKSEI
jgi:hypothetical protein